MYRSILCAAFAFAAAIAGAQPDSPPRNEAATLAARAEQVLDHWDGDAKALAEAGDAIAAAVKLEPDNAHYRGIEARQLLLANTTEEGIKPSALGLAHGILMRAAWGMPPHDARAMAFLAMVKLQLNPNDPKVFWAMKSAERANPNDPYVKLAQARYEDTLFQGAGLRYVEAAVDAGLASPVELRKAHAELLPAYAGQRNRDRFDRTVAAMIQLDPANPYVRGNAALNLVEWFVDFKGGERMAREALAIMDYPHARGTLSLALYGQWAEAVRDGKDKATVEELFRKAYANDPNGRMIPTCAAEWKPLEFVFTALDSKALHVQDMRKC